ncbi:MAG: ABC transporter permease, partial [Acidobacteriota bacterium]
MLTIPITYNIRNIWVRKVSALLAIMGVALAVGVFLIVMMLVHGLRYALVQSGSESNAIVLRKGATAETLSGIARDWADVISTAPEIALAADGTRLIAAEAVVGVNLPRRGRTGTRSGSNVTVRGIVPASLALREQVRILEGRPITAGRPEIIAGRNASRGFENCQLGGSIRMGGLDWRIVGVFEAAGSAFESELWGDRELLMNAYGRENSFSSVTLRMKEPGHDVASMQERFDGDPRLNVLVQTERAYYEASSAALTLLISILGGVLVVLFSIGAVMGAMVTMFAFVGSRTREIATLRALGFTRLAIITCFMIESFLLTLVGGLLASIPARFVQQLTFSTTNFNTFTDVP